MTLEPPGLDPTAGAASADRRDHAVQHLRDADQDQCRRQRHAAAGRKLGGLARPEAPTPSAAQGREVPERRAVQRAGGEVLLRPRRRREEHQQGQAHLRQPQHAGGRRAHGGGAQQGDRPRLPVPAGPGHGRHRRAQERRHQRHQAGGHRPLQARELDQGLVDRADASGTATATPAPSRSSSATFRFISDPAAQVAALLAGDVDAFPRVTPRSVPQFKDNPQVPGDRVAARAPRPSWRSTTRRSRWTTCACAAPSPRPSTARR